MFFLHTMIDPPSDEFLHSRRISPQCQASASEPLAHQHCASCSQNLHARARTARVCCSFVGASQEETSQQTRES